jgi:ATP-dependent RNA helicase DDX51/DBP6
MLVTILAEAVGLLRPESSSSAMNGVLSASKRHSQACSEQGNMCIIFTSSVDSTHRLTRLLQLMNEYGKSSSSINSSSYLFGGRIAEISSLLRLEEREEVMLAAASGDVKILVSTDNMARGIDLPNIKLVINYDPPKHARAYIHRVGRTARANRTGHALTMLKLGQVGSFHHMRSELNSSSNDEKISKAKIAKDEAVLSMLSSTYQYALSKLQNILSLEQDKKLSEGEPIPLQ